nr:hypothetical protein [Candidatus Sarmatiella mevalonica]
MQEGREFLSNNSLVSFILRDFQILESTPLLLSIESQIPIMGLGSSGALIACMTALLLLYTERISLPLSYSHLELIYQRGWEIARAFQSSYSSGSDIACSILGGMILHRKHGLCVNKSNSVPYEICLIYCGYKRKTADIIWLTQRLDDASRIRLFKEMDFNSLMLFDGINNRDNALIRNSMNSAHRILQNLGMSDFLLDSIVQKMNAQSRYGAKISGSGLGDCALTFSAWDDPDAVYAKTPLPFAPAFDDASDAMRAGAICELRCGCDSVGLCVKKDVIKRIN